MMMPTPSEEKVSQAGENHILCREATVVPGEQLTVGYHIVPSG